MAFAESFVIAGQVMVAVLWWKRFQICEFCYDIFEQIQITASFLASLRSFLKRLERMISSIC